MVRWRSSAPEREAASLPPRRAPRRRAGSDRSTASDRRRGTACRGPADLPPVVCPRVVGGEKKQDLGLKGISVLELVDEEVREALLQLARARGVVANEVARPDEEVEKIELAVRAFASS